MTVTTKEFLNAFISDEGVVQIRSFPDLGSGYGKNETFYLKDWESKLKNLTRLNSEEKEGIFFVVNAGGHKDRDINQIKAQFVESDQLSLEEQYKNLMNFVLEPSIIVKTRKSLHGYWLIKNGDCDQFSELQKALATFFKGDPVIKNLSRVMRLPGFYHQKKEPLMVRCIHFKPENVYTQEELFIGIGAGDALVKSEEKTAEPKKEAVKKSAHLPMPPLKQTHEHPFVYQAELAIKNCEFLSFCKSNASNLSEPFWFGMMTNLAPYDPDGFAIHQLSQGYLGYSKESTKAKIKHALATHPMGCQALKAFGFTCKNLETCEKKHPWEKGIPPLPPWYQQGKQGHRLLNGVLSEHLKKTKNLIYSADTYFAYKNGVYQAIDFKICLKLIRQYCDPKQILYFQLNDVLSQWTLDMMVDHQGLDAKEEWINLKNGLFNLKTQTLEKHDPQYLSIVQLEASYEKEASCKKFLSFLNEALDVEMHPLVQEIFGYLLVPQTKAQKSFIFVGEGGAGKSTLLTVIQDALLGSRNVSNISWQNLGDRFKTAELYGKLANIFSDLPTKNIEDDDLFKSITGEDRIMADRKHKSHLNFIPKARLVFSCNEIPRNLGDRSSAFFRRLTIIPFLKAKQVSKRDVNLKEQLKKEASGILNWALVGFYRLENNHFIFSDPQKSKDALENYKISGSSVLSFVEDRCCLEQGKRSAAGELFTAYKNYANSNGLKAVSQKRFGNELGNIEEILRKKDNQTRRFIYEGIALLVDKDGFLEKRND